MPASYRRHSHRRFPPVPSRSIRTQYRHRRQPQVFAAGMPIKFIAAQICQHVAGKFHNTSGKEILRIRVLRYDGGIKHPTIHRGLYNLELLGFTKSHEDITQRQMEVK